MFCNNKEQNCKIILELLYFDGGRMREFPENTTTY